MNWQIIITGVTALIGGAIGAIGSPWIKWHLENKRENRKERIELITSLRSLLETVNPKDDEFLNFSAYSRLRPYLSKKLVNELEDSSTIIIERGSGSVRDPYINKILEELSQIEDSWNIGLPNKKSRKKHSNNKETITISSH